MVVLCGGISTLIGPSISWSGTGATVDGSAIGGGMILPNCGSGTVNISGGKAGNQTIGLSAGCNASFDALAWFQRPSPYTTGIPPGWQNTPGTISDCSSSIEAPPGIGSFFSMLAYALSGQVVVNMVTPNPPPQFCAWGDASKGGHISIWEEAFHRVGNANAPIWAPDPPAQQAIDGEKKQGGDPVELATGLFIMEQIDLAIPDLIPLTLTRTYRQNDTASRPFGIGATHPYDIWLTWDDYCSVMQLILPDGARETYTRTSGTDCFTASLVNQTSPSAALQSTLNWDDSRQRWSLRRKDGMIYRFSSMTAYSQLLLMELEDRNGNRATLVRDSLGRLQNVLSPSGKFLQFTYDANNRITQVSDNAGRTVTYVYDGSGRLWKVTHPGSEITEYTYDTSHRMLTIKDPKNITYLTNTYDANGRVATQTQADSTTYQFAYTLDGSGKVTQTDVTDPRNIVRRVTFNSDGYALTDTTAFGEPEAQTTTYTRQAGTNLILSVTDALNRQTAHTYDTKGNLLTVTRLATTPNAVTRTFTYEPTYSQVATITDPLNHTTTFGYDPTGNVTTITNALSEITTLTVNPQGQPLTVTDPLNNTTTLTYAQGDLITTTDPLNRVSTRFVDPVGRLLALTDPNKSRTQYDVDALNRVTKLIDPLNGQTQMAYDPNSNLLTVSDAKSQVTTYTYNNMDRVATRQDALLNTETYTYDNNGNVATVTDRRSQVTTYTYDVLNRRTKATFQDGTSTNYTYDAGNRITQVQEKDSGGTVTATVTRTYDGLDQLTQEVTPEGTVNYTYDNASRRATMTVVGQTQVTYTYDNADRLTQVQQGTSTVTIAYDIAGRRTSLTLPNTNSVTYGYNGASELTSLTYKQGATTLGDLTYTYEPAGNRIKIGGSFARTNLPPALATTSYNANNQQTTFGTSTETFDLNDNLATFTDVSGTTTYTWNARNQLASISGPSLTASFTYDSFGRRTGKTINGTTTNFLYDGLTPVQEKSGATVTANLLTGLGIDEFFTRTDGVGVRVLFPDALGSTVALSDSTGTVQTQYTYEPFGATAQTGAASTNSYKYTGREDDSTGLHFYRARYYQPRLQRFIAEDPLGFGGRDFNVYAYVANNPANLNDPTGEIVPQLIGCAIGAGAAIGVDKLSGRKINLIDAGLGCAVGALGGFIYSNSFKFALHDPHHYFSLFGRNLPHIQMNW
jgi:RHS repeat-associated protein